MMRRYELKAVFNDRDFGDIAGEPRLFWTKHFAMNKWADVERMRRSYGADQWHYIVTDLKTGEELT
jgi:hypothetical protein